MLYAILGEDAPGSLAKRLAARPAHLERLKELQEVWLHSDLTATSAELLTRADPQR